MESKKLTKELIDSIRHIDGFPIGSDEDIMELSDAPYYTACPNPFINDFINEYGTEYDEETDNYHRVPFSYDVVEGKTDPIYNAHSYHTKVPYKAIMRYILHYTEPGDIVFDGFAGSGMTGIASQMCGAADLETKMSIEKDVKNVKWGYRYPILNDISTYAAFTESNYNKGIDIKFEKEANRLLEILKTKYGYLYETIHTIDGIEQKSVTGENIVGNIKYVVWSDIFSCNNCAEEFIFYDIALDEGTKKTLKEFKCPKCKKLISRSTIDRVFTMNIEDSSKEIRKYPKKVPVLINYIVGKSRYFKKPDKHDLKKLNELNQMYIDTHMNDIKIVNGDETGRLINNGIEKCSDIYNRRALLLLSDLYKYSESNKVKFWINSALPKLTILNRYMPEHGSRALVGPMSGTFYAPPISVENNVFMQLEFQLKKILKVQYNQCESIVTNQSSTDLSNIKDNSIDYIFIDPPFGDNLMYSELNNIVEGWLKVRTNNNEEAVVNKTQKKDSKKYLELMTQCLKEMYRILKPGRWITIEFHNSKNTIWNMIQESIIRAGFITADVRILNKGKGTINQFNAKGAVKHDLVISAYKPREKFMNEFLLNMGTEEAVWDFIKEHLENLPISINNGYRIEKIVERENYLLFDRMIAFHIQNGISIPMDAGDFYRGLNERFVERDGMYFLPAQVNQYDQESSKYESIEQLSFIVTDEKTAIQWVRTKLEKKPQTYQDLQPNFLKELHQVKHEKLPELMDMLQQNFLKDEDGKWYVPDLSKQSDLEKIREKSLLKEFEEYLRETKKLKQFRTEAVRLGFKKCWKDKSYETIVKLAKRLPETVIQEDQTLLMYYDNALMRVEE